LPATTRRKLLKTLSWTMAGAAIETPSFGQRASATRGDALRPREREALATLARAFGTQFDVPGLSLAIASQGRLLYSEAFGFADGEATEPLTPDHRFRIASVSKPITAVALFDLIERGRLSLTDRVFGRGAVLGTRFGKAPYGRYVEEVTIAHLLTHTGGGWTNDAGDPMFSNPRMTHAELIAWTLESESLENAPGTAYAYSNFGYCVLGRVIEAVTGRPYVEHVQERILAPCGIGRMAVGGNTLGERQPLEVRYDGRGENSYGMNVRRMDAHGGWLATASDLVTFALRVDGFATTPDLLRANTIRRMVTPPAVNRAYAHGWSVNRADNWWHGGSLPGTTSLLVRTASGFCWAALANTRRRSGMATALDKMMWDMSRAAAWR
jgi:CubicO group peptidase (beta-lactamase class C family)